MSSGNPPTEQEPVTSTKDGDPFEWLRKLEDPKYNPHTISKHAPDSSSTDLFNQSLKLKSPQTKFTSIDEMVDSIMQTIDDHLADINEVAETANPGQTNAFLGQRVQ